MGASASRSRTGRCAETVGILHDDRGEPDPRGERLVLDGTNLYPDDD